MGYRLRVRMYVWRSTRSERGTRTRSFKRGKPIAGLVVPLAAGVCFDVADVWSIWHRNPSSHVPGLVFERTVMILAVLYNREPTIPKQNNTASSVVGNLFQRSTCIGIDWNYTRKLQLKSVHGLWFVPDCMRKRHTSDYKVICRTKYILPIARGCGDSIERKSRAASLMRSDRFRAHDSSSTTAGFYRIGRKYRSRCIVHRASLPGSCSLKDPICMFD